MFQFVKYFIGGVLQGEDFVVSYGLVCNVVGGTYTVEVGAVSYTHLDVYKRQAYHYILSALNSNHFYGLHTWGYLDVYKRQYLNTNAA